MCKALSPCPRGFAWGGILTYSIWFITARIGIIFSLEKKGCAHVTEKNHWFSLCWCWLLQQRFPSFAEQSVPSAWYSWYTSHYSVFLSGFPCRFLSIIWLDTGQVLRLMWPSRSGVQADICIRLRSGSNSNKAEWLCRGNHRSVAGHVTEAWISSLH